MEIIGLDLHKRESQLSSKADDGSITDRRIATSRERFTMDVVADADVRGGQFSSTKSSAATACWASSRSLFHPFSVIHVTTGGICGGASSRTR